MLESAGAPALRVAAAALILAPLLPAQDGEAKQREHAGAREVLEAVAEKYGKARTLRARYRQERTTVLMKKPLVSEGRLLLRLDPACLVFLGGTEARRTVIRLTREEYACWRPADKTLERTPFARPTLPDTLFRAFRPEPAKLEADFAIRETKRSDGLLTVHMEPRHDHGTRFLKEFSLTVDERAQTLHSVAYRDPQGDQVTLVLSELRLDPKLEPDAFALDVPKDTKVLVHEPIGRRDEAGTASRFESAGR